MKNDGGLCGEVWRIEQRLAAWHLLGMRTLGTAAALSDVVAIAFALYHVNSVGESGTLHTI